MRAHIASPQISARRKAWMQDVISKRDDTSHPAQLRYESSVVYCPRPGTGRVWRCNWLDRSNLKRRLLWWRLCRKRHHRNRHSGYNQYDLTAEMSHIFLDGLPKPDGVSLTPKRRGKEVKSI
jgi:hypothetical protein